ncbi:MAG: tetratricopeptide repeat protein [Candidatus Melainabacteria bacterium]|nr:tetratricopeptide repeat protein [Candidatus Melainabacteria bacterium]
MKAVGFVQVVVLVSVLLASSVEVVGKPSASSKVQLGELLFFNGNIDGAINAFRHALILDPNLWQAHLNLVNMYIQKNDFPKAIEECREVLKAKPGHKDVHLILGNLLRAQNDLDGAEQELKKAIASGASPALAHNALGLTMLQKGNLNGAHEHISQALLKQKNFADAHLVMGIVLFKKGDKDKALQEIELAIKKKEKYPEAHNAKGDILSSDGKWQEALAEYKKAVTEEPKYAQAFASMGNAYLQLSDTDSAKEAYARARELNPTDKNILYGLALMLEKSKRIDEALAEFQNALMLETDPMMAAQIRVHMNQLRQQKNLQFTIGGQQGAGGMMPGFEMQNPFGHSYADLIKIKPLHSSSKPK